MLYNVERGVLIYSVIIPDLCVFRHSPVKGFLHGFDPELTLNDNFHLKQLL